jgi:hypothetical protein
MAIILPEAASEIDRTRPFAALGGAPGLYTSRAPLWCAVAAALGLPAAMLCYAAAVCVLCHALGHGKDFNVGLYVRPVFTVYCLCGILIFLTLLLRHFLGRSGEPILWFRKTWAPKVFLRHLAWTLPLLLTMPFFLTAFTGAKNLLNDTLPFAWDDALDALSRQLEFGHHTYDLLPLRSPLITRGVEAIYASWGLLFVTVPFLVSLRRVDCPLRIRFFVSYALILVLLGNVLAGAFMSAGPFWLENNNPGNSGFTSLFAYLKQADPDGVFSAVRFQQYLAAAHLQGLTYLGTGISAFPSIHVAMATLFALVAWPFGVVMRVLSLAFLAVIFIGSVDLGWHYSVDGYASMIFTCAIYGSVGWLQRRFNRRAGAGPAQVRTAHPSQGSPIL